MSISDTLVSFLLITGGTFWLSQLIFHQFPKLGQFMVRLCRFDKKGE